MRFLSTKSVVILERACPDSDVAPKNEGKEAATEAATSERQARQTLGAAKAAMYLPYLRDWVSPIQLLIEDAPLGMN